MRWAEPVVAETSWRCWGSAESLGSRGLAVGKRGWRVLGGVGRGGAF